MTVLTAAEWDRSAGALGAPAWTGDARFATRAARVRHAAELDRHVAEWTRGQRVEEAMTLLQRAGVAAGLVAHPQAPGARAPPPPPPPPPVGGATPEGGTGAVQRAPLRR